jgi:hypothetical protein
MQAARRAGLGEKDVSAIFAYTAGLPPDRG